QPGISTTPSVNGTMTNTYQLGTSAPTLTDSANVTGGYPTLAGSITFSLSLSTDGGHTFSTVSGYPPAGVRVTGDGTYSTPNGYTLPTTGTVVGIYQWNADFTPSDGNDLKASDDNDPAEQVTVTPANPTITTQQGPVTQIGQTLTDKADLEGGYYPTGSVTFYLFAPNGSPNSTYAPTNWTYKDVATVTGNGNIYSSTSGTASGSAVATVGGTYQWEAIYSGDPNNNKATSGFGNEPQVVLSTGSGLTIGFYTNNNGQ